MPFCPNCGTEFAVEAPPETEEPIVVEDPVDNTSTEQIRQEGETERAIIEAEKEIKIAEIAAETLETIAEETMPDEPPEVEIPKPEPDTEDHSDEIIEEKVSDIPAMDENDEPDSVPETKEHAQAREAHEAKVRQDARPRSRHGWWGRR
jgi:hypothetical protein